MQQYLGAYTTFIYVCPRAPFTNCSYLSSFVMLCPLAELSQSIIAAKADAAGFKQRPTSNKEMRKPSCSLRVTGSADQSMIELFLMDVNLRTGLRDIFEARKKGVGVISKPFSL